MHWNTFLEPPNSSLKPIKTLLTLLTYVQNLAVHTVFRIYSDDIGFFLFYMDQEGF